MRVGMVVEDARGGLAQYTAQLSNALSKECEVVVFAPEGEIVGYLEGPDMVRTPAPPRLLSPKVALFPWLSRQLRRSRLDIVHLQSVPPWSTLALRQLQGIPRLVTLHDPEIHPGDKGQWLLRASTSIAEGFADHLIVHGRALKQKVAGSGIPAKRISVIPHGDYSFLLRWRLENVTPESVLFFGRIRDYKGLEYLLKAAPAIHRTFPDTPMVIAGRGSLYPYPQLDRQPWWHMQNGFISDPEVAHLFSRAKVVVLPYVQASQSGIIPVAYAFGVPVVASRVGAIPEVVVDGETGILVPPRDPQALEEAISRLLLDEELRARMGKAALRYARRRLSWKGIAGKTMRIYRQLLEERNAA